MWRRVKTGQIPAPIDRGRQALFASSDIVALAAGYPVDRDDRITQALEARLEQLKRRSRAVS